MKNWSSALLKTSGVLVVVLAVVVAVWACYPGRMTGGGSVFKGDLEVLTSGSLDGRVTHGFEIHCDVSLPNNLEINWAGSKFHLESLDSASCSYDQKIDPRPPAAGFNTFEGWGTGKYNGVDGATIHFIFTDAGEPGTQDTAWIEVVADNQVVLTVYNHLWKGNHQAHKN